MAPRAKRPQAKDRDALRSYREKRNFTRTPEPEAQMGTGESWQFVVQKHDARRLHFDLRLELGGTLKSWAITRGPSLDPREKRLAVRTEDHPMQYLDFEGVIPKGEYGGGSMIVWDRGEWTPIFDPVWGMDKGHLEFLLNGSRLHGRWHLVRMKPKPSEKRENWLLIKAEDADARTAGEPSIVDTALGSLLSGQTNAELAAKGVLRKDHAGRANVARKRVHALPEIAALPGARKGILPAFLAPSLASQTVKPPRGSNWIHEIKFDGYRLQARIDGRSIQLRTRNNLDWTGRFPNIARTLRDLELGSALIDGEVVVEDAAGIPSFTRLQAELSSGTGNGFAYYMFDLLYCEGFDLTQVSLLERKNLLNQIAQRLPPHSPLRYSEHLSEDGPTMFEHACKLGLEGIVSKRTDLPYRAGRGGHWLKAKSSLRAEFIILGYVPSTSAKGTIGALLMGCYGEDQALNYCGRVGTGYSANEARALKAKLDGMPAHKPELANAIPASMGKGVRWTDPKLVCEVEYRGWSADRLLRQAAFKGLREDLLADEIRRTGDDVDMVLVRQDLDVSRLTHRDRLLWPEAGVTKEGLAEFYSDIAPWILPHVEGRVLSLLRAPEGVGEKTFFAKHPWHGLGDAVQRIDVGEAEPMLALNDFRGLLELVQASVVEIHPWGSKSGDLDKPDRLIFDLDPGEDVPWTAVIEGAQEVRSRLDDLGLKCFVKTSGGKGLHVVLPLTPKASWDEAKIFTQKLAQDMAKGAPARYAATMAKRERRGRIFVDYLRNDRGSTAVAPYSTRAVPTATVSVPLSWEELSEAVRSQHYTIGNVRQRLSALKSDPWAGLATLRQRLPVPAQIKKARAKKSFLK